MNRTRQWFEKRWGIPFLLIILLTGGLGLYGLSNGHIPEYFTWRWMVTFKLPVTRVDDYRIVVAKSEHRLVVYEGDREIKAYRVALSAHSTQPRRIWEDELTPEGIFLIASMQYESRFGPRQMLLETTAQSIADYGLQYAAAGRKRLEDWNEAHGLLDTIWEVYDFNEGNPQYPIWNDILIHGGGSASDWTMGCIALDDADVIELFEILRGSRAGGLGVAVEIRP